MCVPSIVSAWVGAIYLFAGTVKCVGEPRALETEQVFEYLYLWLGLGLGLVRARAHHTSQHEHCCTRVTWSPRTPKHTA